MSSDHGIVFTPASVKGSPTLMLENLHNQNIAYVHIYWVDLANTRRSRVLALDYFLELMKSNRPGVNIAKVGLGLVYLMMPEGFTGIGEYLYVLDISTLRILRGVGPDGGSVAAVLGRFEEKNALRDGPLVKVCPRTLLGRLVDDAKPTTEFLVGFESEFILLKSTNPVQASNIHNWCAADGLLAGSTEAVILREIGDALRSSGIALQMYHAEAAPGQYEVVTGPLSPLEAADALVYTREIIVQVSAKHGLRASFAPRPFMYSAGTSTHGHISVHTKGEKKTAQQLSPPETSFLAGILEHLPAITLFALPTPASYKRVADGVLSGGSYVSYGTENRESAIRLTNVASPASRNFEMRFIDGTASPYLALAAILAAGLSGIKDKQTLLMKDCQDLSAAQMTEEKRTAMGITKRMPMNIEEARKNLRDDATLTGILGKEMVTAFLAVNKTLGDALTQEEDEEQQLTRLVEFY
ncbi:hypothetical protein C8J56DRAFT_924631 [Mycena floridula]|nr:hypothetical protein C8J56DRAFT_924631 [Mycena floridula]